MEGRSVSESPSPLCDLLQRAESVGLKALPHQMVEQVLLTRAGFQPL